MILKMNTPTPIWAWFVTHKLGLAIVGLYDKFEASNKDLTGAPKLLSRILWPRPLLDGLSCMVELAMVKVCTKYEVSQFAFSTDKKGNPKFTKYDGLQWLSVT